MNVIVLIDTGTTNTRVVVFKGDNVITSHRENIGARDVDITGNKDILILLRDN